MLKSMVHKNTAILHLLEFLRGVNKKIRPYWNIGNSQGPAGPAGFCFFNNNKIIVAVGTLLAPNSRPKQNNLFRLVFFDYFIDGAF